MEVRARYGNVDVVANSTISKKTENITEILYTLNVTYDDGRCRIALLAKREMHYEYDPVEDETTFWEIEEGSYESINGATCLDDDTKWAILDMFDDEILEAAMESSFFYHNQEDLLRFAKDMDTVIGEIVKEKQ